MSAGQNKIDTWFSWVRRAPVLHSLSEHGLAYEDVTFPARDGVPLEGWFIAGATASKSISRKRDDERNSSIYAMRV
jgi:hypothetical protein